MRATIEKYLTLILILFTILIVVYSAIPLKGVETGNTIGEEYIVSKVIVFKLDGDSIDQGVSRAILKALDKARREHAILVLLLHTPGGELSSTMRIVEEFLRSDIPIIGFVHKGYALSAGTIILLSTHIAAMAPGTVIGASQPVTYNPLAGVYKPVNESKILNPIVKMLEVIAEERGRNKTAAKAFVLENLSLDPKTALKYHVIDIIAYNVNDLLEKINGKTIRLIGNKTVKILIKHPSIEEYEWGLAEHLVHVLSDPLLSSLLFMLGFYILLLGLLSGQVHVAVVGILLFLLGLVGVGFSINILSAILMLLGSILLVIELFVIPGFGIVGITGIVMIVLGILLMPYYLPERWIVTQEFYQRFINTALIVGSALGAFFAFALYKIIKAKRLKPRVGVIEQKIGEAIEPIKPGRRGFIIVNGEYWLAESEDEIKPGDKVIVIAKSGPILKVKKLHS